MSYYPPYGKCEQFPQRVPCQKRNKKLHQFKSARRSKMILQCLNKSFSATVVKMSILCTLVGPLVGPQVILISRSQALILIFQGIHGHPY